MALCAAFVGYLALQALYGIDNCTLFTSSPTSDTSYSWNWLPPGPVCTYPVSTDESFTGSVTTSPDLTVFLLMAALAIWPILTALTAVTLFRQPDEVVA